MRESISEDAACLLHDNTLKTAANKEQDGYESPTTVKSPLEEMTDSEPSPVKR